MSEKVKKPLWKKWWFWLIVVLVVAAIGNQGGENEATQTTTASPQQESASTTQETAQTAAPAQTSAPAPEPAPAPQPPENAPTMSKAEFEAIQNGMTYEEVVKIVGGEGELLSETGTKGDQFHTVMYKWDGEGSIGANANAMFQGGKMINKSQFGLK